MLQITDTLTTHKKIQNNGNMLPKGSPRSWEVLFHTRPQRGSWAVDMFDWGFSPLPLVEAEIPAVSPQPVPAPGWLHDRWIFAVFTKESNLLNKRFFSFYFESLLLPPSSLRFLSCGYIVCRKLLACFVLLHDNKRESRRLCLQELQGPENGIKNMNLTD